MSATRRHAGRKVRADTTSKAPDAPPVNPEAAKKLILNRKAPAGMRVNGALSFAGDLKLTELPDGLSVPSLA